MRNVRRSAKKVARGGGALTGRLTESLRFAVKPFYTLDKSVKRQAYLPKKSANDFNNWFLRNHARFNTIRGKC